ncbi:MAG: hypothetical protein IGS03_13400 [Candidatus Sericytochromatia bacterium]|nr:hypothetical protein [Candidatus Sericytochromatia bacterium]
MASPAGAARPNTEPAVSRADADSDTALQQIWQPRWQAVKKSWVLNELEDFVAAFSNWPPLGAYPALQQWLHGLQQSLDRFDLQAVHDALQDWPDQREAAVQTPTGQTEPT